MVETRTARTEQTAERIIVVRASAGVRQSLADAQENMRVALQVAQEARLPLLVDISRTEPMEPEARHYYSGRTMSDSFSAMALLIEATTFGRTIGNIYLRIARPGIPARLFTEEKAALEWLRSHLP